MEIGKQIKKYRMELKLSQEQLAEKVFVSRQTISNWENNKNYPDIKSLLLLSSIFDISLDILIKGDIDEMKEEIKKEFEKEDVEKFKKYGVIFSVLLISTMILPIPLFVFLDYVGIIVWLAIASISMYFAMKIEKEKKKFDVQSYKEILKFYEGESLENIEKQQEIVKRPYQKTLLAIGTASITLIIAIVFIAILF